jgi:hypothetical protein
MYHLQQFTGATEEYDGTNWTSPGSLNTARRMQEQELKQQFSFWWRNTPTGFATGATEEYDGSTWTNSPGSLNTARNLIRSSRNSNSWFSFWW